MGSGSIKKIVPDRGFGFIDVTHGREYLFHRSGLDSCVNFDSLRGGESVTFDVEQRDKSPRARRDRLA